MKEPDLLPRKPNLLREPVEVWVISFFLGSLIGIPLVIWVVASLVEFFCY
jgi:hypothetical protein